MRQVVFIHGGNSFSSYQAYRTYLDSKSLSYDKLLYHRGWKSWVAEHLEDTDVLFPEMPNPLNAVYDEWVVCFEKVLPFLSNDFQLVGHSLGANFLAKYLSRTSLPTPAKKVVLVAGSYDDESNEELGDFKLSSINGLENNALEIHLMHSKDDPVVPFSELASYQKDLPGAHVHIFEDRGHFYGTTPAFPEILDILKQK